MTTVGPSFAGISFEENYSSSGSSLLADFYVPAISHAQEYDRATGYFSSALLALAPLVFSEFVARGGKIRLLCSPHLSEEDANAILELPEGHRPATLEVAASSLASMVHGTRLESRAVICLRALIDSGALEMKFVTTGRAGIFHDKIGVFRDAYGRKLSFIGSANETAAAWSGFANHEQIEAFPDWVGESEARRCNRHEEQFEETWLGLRRGLAVTDSADAASVIKSAVPAEPLDDIIDSLRSAVENATFNPDEIALRDYQAEALQSWEMQNFRGVIAFATGGGKTRTALEAIRRWIGSGRSALILVPSELLHKQWQLEITELLGNPATLLVGAGHSREWWIQRLSDYTRADPSLGPRLVISTYQSAVTDRFLNLISGGDQLLVVADEVHRVGAPDTRRILHELDAGGRLGLSATPERFGDIVGTQAIAEYFGKIVTPEFSLRDALDANVLVPYEYDFVTCQLTDDEQDKWDELSLRVAQEMGRNDGSLTDFALHLLRQRARISKSAAGKARLARQVLQENYRDGDRWLVYCSDVNHLREVRAQLDDLNFDLLEYHSNDGGDHKATLDFFTARGGVLLAIKCLDEGVDIPLINRALILASSTNPREYIQRRGRVLRRTPGKYGARLFDVLVVNENEKAITQSEVTRAIEFAKDARNVGPLLYLEELLDDPKSFVAGQQITDIEEE